MPHDVLSGIYKIIYSWFIISLVIIYFDLGETWIGVIIADFGISSLPRVRDHAEVSALPASCALTMTIAWIWPILVLSKIVFALLKDPSLSTDIRQPRLTKTTLIGGWILFALAAALYASGEIYVEFHGDSGIDLLYRFDLNPYLTIIWGGGLWLILSIVVSVPAIAAVNAFHRKA